MPSNVLVSNFPDNQYNGLYVYSGMFNGKPKYDLASATDVYIAWIPFNFNDIGSWTLEDGFRAKTCYAPNDVEFPWLTTTWIDDSFGLNVTGLVMTEVPVSTEPTFGLPAETVALITSRFGTVARFLRLRNQGQI